MSLTSPIYKLLRLTDLGFVAWPYVFTGIRGWSPGISGLAFTGMAIGCFTVIGTEPLLRRMINNHRKDPETGKVPPEAMVSVVCIAAVLAPIGELWFAWTCVPPVHWIWPILAGIPFGAGNTGVFIYASNYLAQSYGSKYPIQYYTLSYAILRLIIEDSICSVSYGRQLGHSIPTWRHSTTSRPDNVRNVKPALGEHLARADPSGYHSYSCTFL